MYTIKNFINIYKSLSSLKIMQNEIMDLHINFY